MNIAIIPARSGSKRIPDKNIKRFLGKPLMAYSIEVALQSQCFDRVIVSTDDDDIANIAIDYGAEVPFMRPQALSDDYATTADVMAYTLTQLGQASNTELSATDAVCCIYATAPFIQATYLQQGLKILTAQPQLDYAFSATSFAFPIQRGFVLDNGIQMLQPEHALTRSQDLPEVYHDAGQFYWGRPLAFIDKRPFFTPRSEAVIIPRKYVQDIDTIEDWESAELMYQLLFPAKVSNT